MCLLLFVKKVYMCLVRQNTIGMLQCLSILAAFTQTCISERSEGRLRATPQSAAYNWNTSSCRLKQQHPLVTGLFPHFPDYYEAILVWDLIPFVLLKTICPILWLWKRE